MATNLLVDRDHQTVRISGKAHFHAIRVMCVDIDISKPLNPMGPKAEHGKDWVIEITKPIGPVGHAMVGPAGGVVDYPTIDQELSGQNRTTGSSCRSAEDLRKTGLERVPRLN